MKETRVKCDLEKMIDRYIGIYEKPIGGIPTSLSLPSDQVDLLRDVAARLLYTSPDLQRLVADMGGKISTPAETVGNAPSH